MSVDLAEPGSAHVDLLSGTSRKTWEVMEMVSVVQVADSLNFSVFPDGVFHRLETT